MDCQDASERLPWLLGGGLNAGEADEVRAHLAHCARCREEMADTRRAAAVFDAHLPTAAIVDLAWDRPVEGLADGVVRAHLDGCPECSEELALTRLSRDQESSLPEAGQGRSASRWRWTLLPATLAAGVVLGLAGGHAFRPAPPDQGPVLARIATLESEVARLRASARAPRLNLPLFEILATAAVRGGRGEEPTSISVPAGAQEIALLLGTDLPLGTPASLTIAEGGGREVWKGDGLVAGPPGGYVVVVPAELLASGAYVLTVRPARGAPREYRVQVQRAP